MQKGRAIRRRSLWAAALLVLVLGGYALFAPVPEGRGNVVSQELWRLFRPLNTAVVFVTSGISSLWTHYIDLTHASAENDRLHQEVAQLQEQVRGSAELQMEATRLQALLSMSAPWSRHPVGARVIAASPLHDIRTIIIDRGWADGIVRDRPVLAAGGLVGRVRVLTEHTATVLLLTDPNSSVDVIDTRSRVRGLLVGALRGTAMQRPLAITQLEFVAHDSDILENDELITSGMDGIYPKGLPVGRVQELRKDEFGLFEDAWVLPLADISRLEEVVVL